MVAVRCPEPLCRKFIITIQSVITDESVMVPFGAATAQYSTKDSFGLFLV